MGYAMPKRKKTARASKAKHEPEPLWPELEVCLCSLHGVLHLKHEFYCGMVPNVKDCGAIHNLIREGEREADEHWENKRWSEYVFVHREQFWLEAFHDCEPHLTNAEYWSILASIYRRRKMTHQDRDTWRNLFRSSRQDRHHLMEQAERDALARLPDTLTIYRGFQRGEQDGLSWTLDQRIANWFAYRGGSGNDPSLVFGTITKANVLAFFDGLEVEIIALPEQVKNKTVQPPSVPDPHKDQASYVTPPFDITTLYVS